MRLWKHLCALVLASGLVVSSAVGVAGPALAEDRDTTQAGVFGEGSGDGRDDPSNLPGVEEPGDPTGTDGVGAGSGADSSGAAGFAAFLMRYDGRF